MDQRPPLIRLAVFGKPIAQSLSPRIHGLFAHQLGLNVDYRAIEADPKSFPHLVTELAENGARGCNITVPLKRDAWKLAARCSESASRAEAANTLVFFDTGEWYADNTDGRGLVHDLESHAGFGLSGANICLLGAGGAAAGVLAALMQAAPANIVIANRTASRGIELAERHADLGSIRSCTPAQLATWAPYELVINATSLGHTGTAPKLSSGWFAPGGMCYDMNYGMAAKPLERLCEQKGISFCDGLGMLVAQAALSFELWTGQAPLVADVLDQLRQASG